MAQLTWIFDDAPKAGTNEQREWPCAIYHGPFKKFAAFVVSWTTEQYTPTKLKSENHRPLGVIIMRYNDPRDVNFKGRRELCSMTFNSFREVAEFTQKWIDEHPEWQPVVI